MLIQPTSPQASSPKSHDNVPEHVYLERQTQLLPMNIILKLNRGEVDDSDLMNIVFHLNDIQALGKVWTVEDLAEYVGIKKRFENTKGIKKIKILLANYL